MNKYSPVVLCILDGWGQSDTVEGNAPLIAKTPNFDNIMANSATAKLVTHGTDVGLPHGQMGNSEVGHTNIGAGRVVSMDLGQIDLEIENGSFYKNNAILKFVQSVKSSQGIAHVIGLLSDGGVHGHIDHLLASLEIFSKERVGVALHLITDGRDVAPVSALKYADKLLIEMPRNVVISAANHFNTTIEESVSRLLNNTNLGGDINNNKSANKVTTHLTTWSMHYNSWKALKIRERYLLIKYEDLTKNTEKVFIRILDFIYDLINQKYVLDKLKMKNILKTTSFDYVQQLEKEKNFPEKAKHGEDDEKTFFKYGPNLNKKEILNTKLKDKIETELKNDMTELGYL